MKLCRWYKCSQSLFYALKSGLKRETKHITMIFCMILKTRIEFYRKLVSKMRTFITNNYEEPDAIILCCLLDTYGSSMETAYQEYNKSSIFTKWQWKKRVKEQFFNIMDFCTKYILQVD